MATLTGPYRIDRTTPPKNFYTLKEAARAHADITPGVTVLAITNQHPSTGYATVGVVSKQTPFGQGWYMGVAVGTLQRATRDQILHALTIDHPQGPKFRPACAELGDAAFCLLMSEATAPQGWTADRTRPGSKPVVPLTRKQVESFGRTAAQRYEKIMATWDEITQQQIAVIRNLLR